MIKRIYKIILATTLISIAPLVANQTTDKVVKKDKKVVVKVKRDSKKKKRVIEKKSSTKLSHKDKKTSNKKIKKGKTSKKSVKKAVAKSTKNIKKPKSSNKKISKVKKIKKVKIKEYKVENGDTIFSIARKFKVSISDLQKSNKFTSNYLIHPGDSVKIPLVSYEEAAKKAVKMNKLTVYIVKNGDTLSEIAEKFNMPLEKLRKINNFKKSPKIKIGMELNVVGTKRILKERKHSTRYQVKRGDTLWSISKKFNLTMSELKLLNPKVRRRGLKKGSIINVSKRKAVRLATLMKKRKKRLNGLLSKYRQRGFNGRSSGGSKNVVSYAKRFLGVRYRWGATGRGGFDCSGFTQYVMRRAKGKSIPRVSRRQAYYGKYVSRRNLRAGDLIFFDTSRRRRGYVNHVGIYIGHGRFIHASSGKHRVVITSLNKPFYRSRFLWGRRIR